MMTDDEVRARFGPDTRTSHQGRFVLVHLDNPSEETVRRRTVTFDPDLYFEPGCPLCELQRIQGFAVFDTYPDEAEDILVD